MLPSGTIQQAVGCLKAVKKKLFGKYFVARGFNVWLVVHALAKLREMGVDEFSSTILISQRAMFRDGMPGVVGEFAGEGKLLR